MLYQLPTLVLLSLVGARSVMKGTLGKSMDYGQQQENQDYPPSYPSGKEQSEQASIAYPSGKKSGEEQAPQATPVPYPEESPDQSGAKDCPEKAAKGGSAGTSASGPFIIKVGAGGLNFEPKDLKVPVGATVEWQFEGGPHNVKQVADATTCEPMNGGFTTPENLYSGSFTQVMNSPGKTWFACTVGQHCQSGMRGLITVGDESATAPTNADPPAETADPADPASSQAQSSEQQSAPQEWTVNVGEGGLKYSPDNLTINQGDTVNFVFVGGTHDVVETSDASTCTPKAGGFASEVLSSGTFKQQFNEVGTKWYVCSVGSHCDGGMKAKIVVAEKGSVAAGGSSSLGFKSAVPVWTGLTVGVFAGLLVV